MSQLNVGTKVVLMEDVAATSAQPAFPRGSIGMITKMPGDETHSFRLRFPDGGVGAFRREKFCTLHLWQQQDANQPHNILKDYDLHDYICYHCIVGSRAYGLSHEGSDVDHRGIYLPPARLHWSLHGVPEQLEDKSIDACYWEFQKFVKLALKANPNILECLYSPLVERKTAVVEPLLAHRQIFLSKLLYQTYNGYVLSQFKKMNTSHEQGKTNWKNAMHLLRLLISGIVALEEGYIMVDVGQYRDELLAIRRAEISWEAVNERRLELHDRFNRAFEQTALPERPDFAKANEILIEARQAMLDA